MTGDPLFSVTGKTAVVTGGAKGIGALISTALVQAGCKVIIVGRASAASQAFVATLAGQGSCRFLAHDLASMDGVHAAAAEITQHAPALDILVNNAGCFHGAAIETANAQNWDRQMDLNVRAPFFLAQSLLPQLRAAASPADPARIIHIGSMVALGSKSFQAHAYGASKAALHHLTRTMASDLTASHVSVNAIAPGFFPSEMTDGFFAAAPGMREQVIESIPMRRLGTGDDIGGTVLFLCSRAGAYLSGTVLALDGGMVCA